MNYCDLSYMDLNTLNNVNLNHKRKRNFQKNNFESEEDYDSNWTKYVEIDREIREKLKNNKLEN